MHEHVKSVLVIKLKLPEILQKPTHGKPFHLHVGSRDQTQVIGLLGKHFMCGATSPAQLYLSLLNNSILGCIVIMVDYRSLLLHLIFHVPSIIFGINSYKRHC